MKDFDPVREFDLFLTMIFDLCFGMRDEKQFAKIKIADEDIHLFFRDAKEYFSILSGFTFQGDNNGRVSCPHISQGLKL